MNEGLRVLFVSPEVVPFAKTGGLADVAGALPVALRRLGADVRLVLPLYRTVREGHFLMRPLLKDLEVPLGEDTVNADVIESETGGRVPVYLIERDDLYDRAHLYGDERGDYDDNLERFTFLSHGALKIADAISFYPHVIHCHDWQTGLLPVLLKGPYGDNSKFTGTGSVFTIHNIGYQGLFPEDKMSVTSLTKDEFFQPEGLEYWGKMSLLKAGIVYADAITTVSPTYAREIQTPEYGSGMEGIFKHRQDHLQGILNGVDYGRWDPAHDTRIPAHYSLENFAGKRRCKEYLIQEMGLDPTLMSRPILGMISRFDPQKGFDLLMRILEDLLTLNVGLVILGSGEKETQKSLQKAGERYSGRVGIKIGFDESFAHRIMAGADIFLVPSRYEPCGLTQMYALKYGAVPVVRATGGLEDTVVQFEPKTGQGNGFKFGPYHPIAFLKSVRQAMELFRDPMAWRRIMANGMRADFSWERSARNYMALYGSVQEQKLRKGQGTVEQVPGR